MKHLAGFLIVLTGTSVALAKGPSFEDAIYSIELTPDTTHPGGTISVTVMTDVRASCERWAEQAPDIHEYVEACLGWFDGAGEVLRFTLRTSDGQWVSGPTLDAQVTLCAEDGAVFCGVVHTESGTRPGNYRLRPRDNPDPRLLGLPAYVEGFWIGRPSEGLDSPNSTANTEFPASEELALGCRIGPSNERNHLGSLAVIAVGVFILRRRRQLRRHAASAMRLI